MSVSILCFFLLAIIVPELEADTGSQNTSSLAERTSRELLIGWKDGISEAQRDRIIKELNGKLKHRFGLIEADLILFNDTESWEAARLKAVREAAIKSVLVNRDIFGPCVK